MEITGAVREAMIAKRAEQRDKGLESSKRNAPQATEAERTRHIRLWLRGWPDLSLDASKVKRDPEPFDHNKPCCVIHRATGARWLYPEGLGFDQWGSAWGNDYLVVYANMLGFRVQFNESGERWPERRTDYFVVNYFTA